jgi:hypothetical protein
LLRAAHASSASMSFGSGKVRLATIAKEPGVDCGGIDGYYDMLERLRDPGSDDYEETRAWIEDATGGPFDPAAFDLKAVNRALKKLR